jgi:hypothetical protein
MSWWRRLAQNRLLDVGAALIALISVVHIIGLLPAGARRNDFAHYYLSSRLLAEGRNPYTTRLEPFYREYGFEYHEGVPTATNPPPLLWLFVPLALLPLSVAFSCWLIVQTLSLGTILWFTRQLLGARLSARGWRFVCAAAISSATVYWHYYFSQVQLLLTAMVLAAFTLHRQQRYGRACALVTAAALTKLFPAVLIPWFVWRGASDCRARLGRIVVILVIGVAGILATDLHLWKGFVRHSRGVLAANAINHTFNFTVPAFVTNLGFAAHDFSPSPDDARWWWAVGVTAGLGVIALAYLACLRGKQDDETQFCLLCIAMLAGNITTRGHYFVFLIFPVVVAAARVRANLSGARFLWFAMMLLMLNTLGTQATPFLDRHIYLKIIANYIPLYGLIGLGIFFAREFLHSRRAANDKPISRTNPVDEERITA